MKEEREQVEGRDGTDLQEEPVEVLVQILVQQQEHIALLREQVKQLPVLQEVITQLTEQVKSLQERLAKDSHNSSFPPSSDRFARQKKSRSLRKKSGKKTGGQAEHPGTTLSLSEHPDEVVTLPPVEQCEHCQRNLSDIAAPSYERRQTIDVPSPRVVITEYRAEWKQCPDCQGSTHAPFPEGVNAPVQYGPRVGAMGVYLVVQQLLPWGRACEVLADLVGVHLSEGTLGALLTRTANRLVPVEEQIKTALAHASVIHQDETGLPVENRRAWMHVTCTPHLTHSFVHKSRGRKALDAIGILADFDGVSVHDAWAAYFRYECTHALCLVHILRELTFLAEELGFWWAAKLKKLLLAMKAATTEARLLGKKILDPRTLVSFQTRFRALLVEADQAHPRAPTPLGKRGKAKQHPGRNLVDRLRKYEDAIVLFVRHLAVPFDHNLAEQDIRMVKVQQKVSGSFRSAGGAAIFCRIRGSLSTLRKQGLHLFSALEATVRGQPLLPSFKAT